MRDVLEQLDTWHSEGREIAVATVVRTWGSSPRQVGSRLIATREGGIAGSVSGGCVEGAVIEECYAVLDSGQPSLLGFGVADEEAWQVGLPCGGTIQVLVEPFLAYKSIYQPFKNCLHEQIPCALVSYLEGSPVDFNRKLLLFADGSVEGDLDLSQYGKGALQEIKAVFHSGESQTLNPSDDVSLLVEVYPPRERLIIVGAVHTAEKLVSLAQVLGFETIIIDPRRAFNNRERFPEASRLITEWPNEALEQLELTSADYVVILTHDPKLDDPALLVALRKPARYIGALGSKRTNQKRLARLVEAGLTDAELNRLHAPIGLDIGGRRPEEIALSIMAEINKVKYKR